MSTIKDTTAKGLYMCQKCTCVSYSLQADAHDLSVFKQLPMVGCANAACLHTQSEHCADTCYPMLTPQLILADELVL